MKECLLLRGADGLAHFLARHQLQRGLLVREQLELMSCLPREHVDARNDPAFFLAQFLDEQCLFGVIDGVGTRLSSD